MSAIYIPVVLGLLGIHKRHIFFCDIKEKINKEPFLSLSACYAHVGMGTGGLYTLTDFKLKCVIIITSKSEEQKLCFCGHGK